MLNIERRTALFLKAAVMIVITLDGFWILEEFSVFLSFCMHTLFVKGPTVIRLARWRGLCQRRITGESSYTARLSYGSVIIWKVLSTQLQAMFPGYWVQCDRHLLEVKLRKYCKGNLLLSVWVQERFKKFSSLFSLFIRFKLKFNILFKIYYC